MVIITFENSLHQQWTSDFIFTTPDEAKDYLLKQGYTGDTRIMEKIPVGWSRKTKAYITPKKIY